MKFVEYFVALSITILFLILIIKYLNKRGNKHNQLVTAFKLTILCMMLWCLGLVIQILIINYISPNLAVYVDYFVYLPVVFTPVALFFIAYIFINKEIKFKKWYLLLCLIPIITMLILWTNDFHHLFYKYYSINTAETLFGPYFYIHSIYTYGLFAIDLLILLRTSAKKSSLLSKQTLLIFFAFAIPIIVNILCMTLFEANIYITPLFFIFTILFLAVAILRYNFLNVAPIALKRVVDQMSDLYLVLNQDFVISDCNKPFEKTFNVRKSYLIGKYIFDLDFSNKISSTNNFKNYILQAQKISNTFYLESSLKDSNKHFNIEISGIFEDAQCIGILLLFKDITQHILDMEALEKNQNTLLERERLATLGQMVGGIAHNLKTPIMSISGATDGLEDLIIEYDKSIEDSDVSKEDHHSIAQDMNKWISKIRTYNSYMSDIITAVKGQAVNMNDDKSVVFSLHELINRVNILMKHELKNAIVSLNIIYKTDESTTILGNINSLVQVINNLISNAIQSYNGKPNQTIDLVISSENDNIIISVIDHGCGIPKDVQEKLFSQMITTKGHNGTGLGLFMSYSTIKGHFKGNMNFESEVGIGTKFNIIIPTK